MDEADVGRRRADRAVPVEVVAVWLMFAVVAVEILVTYSRVPAAELYHVSGSGLGGGSSRALVFLNFPLALVTLPVLALLYGSLGTRRLRALALLAAALCTPVFWPGVVSQANLDAKPANVPAALGVLLALILTLVLARRTGVSRPGRRPGDAARLVLAAVLVFVALPWFAADNGVFLNGVPGLGWLFQSGPYIHRVAGLPPFPPAVHHGHHHGMDGLLLVLSAMLLWRALGATRPRGLRMAVSAYLALMACYGLGNMANDFWLEQVVKRGWAAWEIPNVLEPRPTVGWGVIVAATAVLWSISVWYESRRATPAAATA